MSSKHIISVIAILLSSALYALPFESFAKYRVKYGFINLGEAVASLKIDENGSYETKIEAKATGFAAVLSGNRVETYKSIGKISDGMLIPDSLEKIRSSNKKSKNITYVFDHKEKQVAYFEERCEANNCFHSSEMLPEYVQNDILTLYHNVAFMFAKDGAKELNVSAVGSREPVNVIVPEGKQLKTAEKLFDGAKGLYLLVVLNQNIFSSDKGRLYINLDDDMTVSRAVLKDTVLFGDVSGQIVEKRVEGSR
jgi:hypothetical protein